MTGKEIFEHFQSQRRKAEEKERTNREAVLGGGGCEMCHYNIDTTWPEHIKPCGQYHCWHTLSN